MDNDALNAMYEFEGAGIVVRKRLHRLAPATVEDRGRRGDARRRRCVLCPHDADKDINRRPGVTARERADLGDGF